MNTDSHRWEALAKGASLLDRQVRRWPQAHMIDWYQLERIERLQRPL